MSFNITEIIPHEAREEFCGFFPEKFLEIIP